MEVPEDSSFEIGRAVVGLKAPPLLAKPHDYAHLSRHLGQRDDGFALRLDGDIVAELSQGVPGQTQLGEDGEVSALFLASATTSLALRRFSSVSPRTQSIWARATRTVTCYPFR